jgi:hypothetical protein
VPLQGAGSHKNFQWRFIVRAVEPKWIGLSTGVLLVPLHSDFDGFRLGQVFWINEQFNAAGSSWLPLDVARAFQG